MLTIRTERRSDMADYDDFFVIKVMNGDITIRTNRELYNEHLWQIIQINGVEAAWVINESTFGFRASGSKPVVVAEVLLDCFGTGTWRITGDFAGNVRKWCYTMRKAQYEQLLHDAVITGDEDKLLRYHDLLEELLEEESIVRLI